VSARYAGASRFARGFVGGKLRHDPATLALLRLAARRPFGDVVDLGCGRGQLGLALLAAGLAERLTGLDLDRAKLEEARRAAAGLPARFAEADLAAPALPCPSATPC
jgi:predicted TPR repeat methyltransferase